MRLAVDQDFPALPSRLWTVFSSPDYPKEKYLALGAKQVELTRFSANEELIEVSVSRVMPIDIAALPSFARKFLSGEQTMKQDSRWKRTADGSIEGTLVITPVGRPISITAKAKLKGHGEAKSRLSFEFEITSDVPLVGGKLAELFAKQVEKALAADHAFTLGYLQKAG